MKILHVLSECYPLIKTGGLADYGFSLPHALKHLGEDVRLLIPGYGDVLKVVKNERLIGELEISMAGVLRHVRILEVLPQEFEVPVWLVDCPALFERAGNPYLNVDGMDWPDNAERFACFAKAGAMLAMGKNTDSWKADVVHCHDWQTGLLPAYLGRLSNPPRSIFTVHNLAYNGLFSHAEFQRLELPEEWWDADEGVEFFGGFSMLKAGVVFADAVTTVSKTYAEEILTPEFGCGMDGAMRHVSHKLSGILNGIDDHIWNPADDPYLAGHYGSHDRVHGRMVNREALFRALDWEPQEAASGPLFGSVGRLVEQKGIDLLVPAASRILDHHPAGFVIIGDGQIEYIEQLMELQHTYPDQVRVFIGYSEELAHLLEAAADFFVMPSRYEPCGLNQLYSMRYGTLPVVRHVGGLADTVVDASEDNLAAGTATGVVFKEPTAEALHGALLRAIGLFNNPAHWAQLQQTAMAQNFGWHNSAMQYLALYSGVRDRVTMPAGMQVGRPERIYSASRAGKVLAANQTEKKSPTEDDESVIN